ncbi:HES5 factor, partial [Campylorhamphus procurvoides]|nr:HES5 factor [Campylorhamphus procurvoides]
PSTEKPCGHWIYSSPGQLEVLLEKGFRRHQPNSELEEGGILGMAVSSQKYGRAPAKSPQQDYYRGGHSRCLRASLQFLSPRSTSTETGMELSCHFPRPKAAPEDSGSPPANPAAPIPS